MKDGGSGGFGGDPSKPGHHVPRSHPVIATHLPWSRIPQQHSGVSPEVDVPKMHRLAVVAVTVSVVMGAHGQDPTVPIRLGYSTILGNGDGVAAFLSAIAVMNSDPESFLGNSSYRVEPYWMSPVTSADNHKLGSMRSIMRLGSKPYRYNRFNGTSGISAIAPLNPNGSNPDVHAIVVSGGSAWSMSMAAIAEFLEKPIIATSATSDGLSDKVRPVFSVRMNTSLMWTSPLHHRTSFRRLVE